MRPSVKILWSLVVISGQPCWGGLAGRLGLVDSMQFTSSLPVETRPVAGADEVAAAAASTMAAACNGDRWVELT